MLQEKAMNAVEVSGVTKTYGARAVVDNLTFTVGPGEIFGLIGPNGAGKTTTIRMMMDIIKPDSGDIKILGKEISEDSKDRIGYLPEERGLYRKLTVMESIVYFAALKNIDQVAARARGESLLRRVDMFQHKDKKVEELSRGMGQIIQVIVTILHDPSLIVLDEPTAGLDPVNAQLLKDILIELRGRDRSIIMSTHRMNEIEELCDRILMIDHGKAVLYGGLSEIKKRYRGNVLILECEGDPGRIEGVASMKPNHNALELVLEPGVTPRQVLDRVMRTNVVVNRFEIATPSLNDIFLKVAGDRHE
jgi:ABC-2 type transport system ATP-binding protein